MVVVSALPPALSGELELFHTTDPLLYNAPVLVFYGPAATIVSSSSRIQVHVFTPAGLESYARLAISPSSPYYAAVNALPREEQGDEVIRGIAFGLSKYFSEIPQAVKECWTSQASGSKKQPASGLFGAAHIAVLASRMTKVENTKSVIEDVQRALGEQSISWLDLDIILPPGSISLNEVGRDSFDLEDATEEELCKRKYGKYAALISALGEPAFLPTSKLKRAPSKPTALGRSQTFRQSQKEMVRKEMCELVDTEESYVQKLNQLVHGAAHDLREQASKTTIPVASLAERAVHDLFPSTLDRIAEINSAFLDAIRNVLDVTEEAAIADIQVESDDSSTSQEDAVGVLQFAKCLVEYLPKFAQDYPEYMSSNAQVPSLIRQIANSSDTTLSNYIHEIGEQRLKSMLIEPIQRLPRYTLYIDTISKQLPVGHPALKPLLKARDVVSDICSQDAQGMQEVDAEVNLQNIVHDWPSEQMSLGRLVSILDASELVSPFEPSQNRLIPGMLLLFSNSIVFLEKSNPNGMTARSLLAEMERPSSIGTGRPRTPSSLHFVDCIPLDSAIFTETLENQAVCVLQSKDSASCRSSTFLLEGAYAHKASRLCEEITKARIEGRFEENEREDGKWDVRSSVSAQGEISLFSAVFEDSTTQRQKTGDFCIVIEPDRHDSKIKAGKNGIQALVSIRGLGDDSWQITVDTVLAGSSRDKVNGSEVLPLVSRRLAILIQAQSSIKNPAVTPALVARNHAILQSFRLLTSQAEGLAKAAAPQDHDRAHRPISPVKMLSSFLASTGPSTPHHLQKRTPAPALLFHGAPSMPPPTPHIPRPASKENSRPASQDQPTPKSTSSVDSSAQANPTKKLEETLSTYLLALQARKGNIVGRVIKARTGADELAINELYNSLLEDANMMVLAAESPVDVLFSSFEKFLNNAWREQLGPVIARPALNAILDKAESSFPLDFQKYFKDTFRNMSSQNQRALRGIVKLLAELLDGTGNDGDRGILTAAFAELLVPGEDPYTFVSLIDRFVDDIESLFGETVHVREVNGLVNSNYGHERSRSVNTGSLTSNTSSLRKKFGFGGLSRENSKSEQESKVGSVWRTLSKNKPPGEQPSSISRGAMQRTKSTDIDTRMAQKRPSSQDRPAVLGAFPFERPPSQDSSTFMASTKALGTIGENPTTPYTQDRKKRRSSLSDLKALQGASESRIRSPSGLKTLDAFHSRQSPAPSLSMAPTTISPTKKMDSPSRVAQRSRLPSSFRKENSPGPAKAFDTSLPRPRSASKQLDDVVITSHASARQNEISSAIPSASPRHERTTSATPVRSGLSERPTSGNAMKIKPLLSPEKADKASLTASTMTPTPTKKLRMQSPQKLRERLQLEQRAITTSQSSLADELSKIGDDLTALGPGRIGSVRSKASPYIHSRTASVPDTQTVDLSKRLADLETLMQSTLEELTTRTTSIQADLASSLTVSETKARNLDELYREANAENEALYSRFNEELGKVLKAVRGGEGVEELRKKVREGSEESGRLRRENARLKREVLGLRSQLKE